MGMSGFCFVVVPGAKRGYRIAIVVRGKRGRFVTNLDDGTMPLMATEADRSERSVEECVHEMNQLLGISRDEANRMLCGALLGWRD